MVQGEVAAVASGCNSDEWTMGGGRRNTGQGCRVEGAEPSASLSIAYAACRWY